MELGEALYTKLSGTAGVSALVSTRIYPVVVPQNGSLPCITYQQISEPWAHAMGTDPGIRSPRYQISAWSTSYSQVKSVAKQVRTALQDFTGTMGGAGGIAVQRVFFEGETDMSDVDPESQAVTHHVAQDFIFWWST